MAFEPLSWRVGRSWLAPRRLSQRFRFRSLPDSLHQKFTCHSPKHSKHNLFVTTPVDEFTGIIVDHNRNCPQTPERRSRHLNSFQSNLETTFGSVTANLHCRQSRPLLQKLDDVFNAKPLLGDRLCFSRRGLITLRLYCNKDLPQWVIDRYLAVALILAHSLKRQRLILEKPHPHIISKSDIKLRIPSGLQFLLQIVWGIEVIIIRRYLSPTNSWVSDSVIFIWWHMEWLMADNPLRYWNHQLVKRSQKWLDSMMGAQDRHLFGLPTSPPSILDGFLELFRATGNWRVVRRVPPDLQLNRQASFYYYSWETEQPWRFSFALGASNKVGSDHFSLWLQIITCVEDLYLPHSCCATRWHSFSGIKQSKACAIKILQLMIVADNVSQSFAGDYQYRIEIAEVAVPDGAQCGLNCRHRSRANLMRRQQGSRELHFLP